MTQTQNTTAAPLVAATDNADELDGMAAGKWPEVEFPAHIIAGQVSPQAPVEPLTDERINALFAWNAGFVDGIGNPCFPSIAALYAFARGLLAASYSRNSNNSMPDLRDWQIIKVAEKHALPVATFQPEIIAFARALLANPCNSSNGSFDASKATEDSEEDAFVIKTLATLLADIAISLKGPELVLHRHSYHDLPELVQKMKLELDLHRVQEATSKADTGEAIRNAKAVRHINSIVDRLERGFGPTDESEELKDISKALSATPSTIAEADEFCEQCMGFGELRGEVCRHCATTEAVARRSSTIKAEPITMFGIGCCDNPEVCDLHAAGECLQAKAKPTGEQL